MSLAEHHDTSKLVALGAGALFVGDLFLTWQRTVVHSSGWTGWGIVAGGLALAVMVLVGARIERPLATLLAATGLLGATALGVTTDGARWPAWLGLVLAAVTLVACLDAYRTNPRAATPRPGGVTPPTAA